MIAHGQHLLITLTQKRSYCAACADKSLRSQWDIEQPTEPYSRKAGSIAAHRGGTRPAESPAVQRMEAQPRSTSPHEARRHCSCSRKTQMIPQDTVVVTDCNRQ